MAKKSNAQKIRDYLSSNFDANAASVAAKFNVKPAYVHTLRSQMRKTRDNGVNIDLVHTGQETKAAEPAPAPAPVAEPEPDMVNHPPHYTAGGIETIDFIEAKKLDYHLGNVVKYVTRASLKGNAFQDLLKARWYLDRAIVARAAPTGE